MKKSSFSQLLQKAQASDWAIPHFNVSSTDQFGVIVKVCQDMKSPVIIGLSEGEADFFGYDMARYIADYWKSKVSIPLFINADHHHSLERAKLAIDAGFDGVNIDCSLQSEQDNLAETLAVVGYAQGHGGVNIEGEIGALPTQSSEIIREHITIDKASLTTPDQAKRFLDATNVDRLTPAVGTLHGILASGQNPAIDFSRLESIAQSVSVPITLHGGSGVSDDDLKNASELVSNIHINTELRLAYTAGIKEGIQTTTTPYKYLSLGLKELEQVIARKIDVFGSSNRA